MMMRAIGIAVLAATFGCGSDGPPPHPDTGAGAGQPVPATETCVDLCARLGDCVVILCDENTNSTQFEGFQDILASQCVSGCTDALVMSSINATAWSCVFQSSCRQVFEHDVCHTQANYHCM
jgi:hypothetical protein